MSTGRRDREGGQSTVEYGLVLFAFLATIAALGMLWQWASDGGLLGGAVRAASHSWGEDGTLGMSQDVLLYWLAW